MALNGKVETEVEIKAPADKFFSIFSSHLYKIPKISSDMVHHVEVVEGDWQTEGSVLNWNFRLQGNALSVEETIEKIDEENKSVTFSALNGEVMKHFKIFKPTVQVTAKEGGSLVKWTMEFEKLNENVPTPDDYLDFAVEITKDIEAHLLKA